MSTATGWFCKLRGLFELTMVAALALLMAVASGCGTGQMSCYEPSVRVTLMQNFLILSK